MLETALLEAKKLSAGYNTEILSHIDLSVNKYELVAILGANGSGKSTLLKTLANILTPIRGIIYINKENIFNIKPKALAKKLSVTLTEKVDAGFMTGFEVVALGRYPYSDVFGRLSETDSDEVMKCLKMVNALDLANKPFIEMSDGEKQKIMIARALAQKPEVMLLDEPTSFLDAKHRIEVMMLLRRIAESGVAVLFTTHDIELAVRVCDRIILISDKRIICSGSPEEVLTSNNIEKIYGNSKAKFCNKLGAFEIECKGDAKIHIVCGGGSGVKIMRVFAKKEIPFTAGILHEGDVDTCVAEICASDVIVEKAFRKISESSFKKAVKTVKGKIILDTGFPVADINARNLELLNFGSKIITFRDNLNLRNAIKVKNIDEVMKIIKPINA